MATIEIRNLCKTYRDLTMGREVVALKDINLDVRENDFFVLLGPSGCGKSTLLNIIAGLTEAGEGSQVLVDGLNVVAPNPKKIAFMFQDPVLYPWRRVLGNVEFGLEAQGVPKAVRHETAMRYLKMVGLEPFADAYPRQLSGGMNQRVALCRALAMETEIVLMDEPFGALDEQTRMILGDELVEIWQRVGKTIIFVTHSISEAIYLGERIAVMTARPGRIKMVVDVNIPRPRTPGSPEFMTLTETLWSDIKEEALKAIGRWSPGDPAGEGGPP